mgnify:CR=1 FL=1
MADFGVLFDLDGLLVDSERVQQLSFNKVLADHGVHLDDEAFSRLVGISTRRNFIALKEQIGFAESVDSIVERKNKAYLELVPHEMRPMPGALALVQSLKTLSIPMAVASSSFRVDVVAPLRAVGLLEYFPRIVAGDEVEHTKPAPDLYLAAAKQVGVHASSCVALEDTQSGLRSAIAAGVPCLVVPNRYTRNHDFAGNSAQVSSLEEVTPEFLRGLLM